MQFIYTISLGVSSCHRHSPLWLKGACLYPWSCVFVEGKGRLQLFTPKDSFHVYLSDLRVLQDFAFQTAMNIDATVLN
jgi:hypothetical protein